jgi:hypothetical protein
MQLCGNAPVGRDRANIVETRKNPEPNEMETSGWWQAKRLAREAA